MPEGMSWLIHDPLTRFVAQIAVIVAASRLLGLLARRVGQPLVVAEIIAGILLGPSLLGQVAPGAYTALFPAGSLDLVRHASELGLVLFVFLVGLELDPTMLRGRLRASLAVSLASLAVPFLLGALLALGLDARDEPTGFALLLGAAMSITAFPVLARLLGEHRLLRTRLGTLALACAAIDDALAWCVLAFIVAYVRAGGLGSALATTGLAIALVAVLLFVVGPLLRRVLARGNRPLAVTHDTVAFVLVGMLASAWVSERIGVHLVFGAFVFGVVVPRGDGFARALAEKLEDLVVVVLLPLFFAVSGLRTHVDLVASADHVLACAAIGGVACAGKFGGSALAARAAGLSWREASALGVLMNTRGLMELIFINIGYELGVFSPTMFSMLVVMVVVTTVATSPLLRRIYPASEAARDLVAVEPRARPRPIYRVLACVPGELAGPGLVTMAHALAGEDAELIALHLAHDAPAGDVLEPALARARELGLSARPLAFTSGDPADDIVRVAEVRDAGLVLLAHGSLDPGKPGAVLAQVLARARATVAVHVDRGAAGAPARVLVPFHGPADDQAALALAHRIRRTTGVEVTVFDTTLDAGAADLVVAGADVALAAGSPWLAGPAALLAVRAPLESPAIAEEH